MVRLSGGSNPSEGRVEVYRDGEWGTVCGETNWNQANVDVVCRQLGFPRGLGALRFNSGSGRIWMADVECRDNDTSILSCPFSGWNLHNCKHDSDVGVRCGKIK